MLIRLSKKRGLVMAPFLAITALSLMAISGCGKKAPPENRDVVAFVNKDPIYASDFKRDLYLRARLDPTFKINAETESEQLDAIINRKLIVQAAMEKGLAREERFVNTIKTFWEQTLIRDFIDYQRRDLQDFIFASEDEIRKSYENMSQKATFKVLKSRNPQFINDAYKKYLKDKDTSGWQAIGPIGYDEASSMLAEAFELNKGEAKRFDDGSNYYLIEVTEKERVELPPLETIKPDIERKVIVMKERRLFENWLKEKRKKATITINKDFLGNTEKLVD